MIPRLKPYLNHKELLAALIPSSGNVEKFEQQFAKKFECEYGVMFQHGRSGLYALLKAWKLENAEVICPAYTCVVVPHAIVLSGNVPVFVDCAEGSFNMDYLSIEKAITDKTRAVIATHLFGYPMDVHKLQEIVSKAEEKYGHKIYIIQDAAHSFGTKWEGELVTKFGDAALFGMNISKIMTTIFGGMITTNSEATYKKLKEFRNRNFKRAGFSKTILRVTYLFAVYFAFNKLIYTFTNWLERKGILDRFVKYYDESEINFPADWNWLPSEIEARVGLVQLRKYDEIIRQKIGNSKKWREGGVQRTSSQPRAMQKMTCISCLTLKALPTATALGWLKTGKNGWKTTAKKGYNLAF